MNLIQTNYTTVPDHFQREYDIAKDIDWDNALSGLSKPARGCLDLVWFLTADVIPREFFLRPSKNLHAQPYCDLDEFEKILDEFEARKLMDQPLMERIEDGQEPCIRVHGVLLMRPKSWAKEPDNLERVYKTTRTLIRRAFPRPDMLKKGDDRLWPTMKKYFSFVMNLGRSVMFWFQPSDPLINSDMVLAELLADGARFCSEVGYQYEAVPMLVTAEKICKNLLAKRPLEVKALYPSVLSLLALYQCFGGIKGKTKATAYISRAISLQEEYMASLPANSVTPVDFLNLGIFYSDQACCYLECEKLSLAEPLLAKVLENYNHVGAQGSQPVRCGIAYSWQSLILAAKGSIKDADDFSKRGCELVRHTLGDSSRETLRITFQRALLMFYNGDRWDSINLHLKVLEEREQRLGLIDHETLSSKYCVAVSQHSLNKHEGAESQLRQILKHTETNLHWREEDLARAAFRLSLVLKQRAEVTRRSLERHLEETPMKERSNFQNDALDEPWRSMPAEINDREKEAKHWAQKARNMRAKWEHLIPDEVGKKLPEYVKGLGVPKDRIEMARFDYGVYLWHGRTAGVWNTGPCF